MYEEDEHDRPIIDHPARFKEIDDDAWESCQPFLASEPTSQSGDRGTDNFERSTRYGPRPRRRRTTPV